MPIPEPIPATTYDFTRWSGRHERIAATEVTFPGGALVFYDNGHLVLAVKSGDWNNLREVAEPDTRPNTPEVNRADG